MTFPDISPYVLGLHWGLLGIRWYALAYIVGILLGWRYLISLVKTPRLWNGAATLTPLQIDDLVLWVTLGVILGGRIGYVLFYMLPYSEARAELFANPLEIFAVWRGGMSFHGGVLGVTLAMTLFARGQKLPVLKLSDLVSPAVPAAMMFGRIANFINGELWGRPTSVPWGMVFCNKTIEAANSDVCPAGYFPRHPSQLYEALLEGVLTFVVVRIATHKGLWLKRKGAVTGLFMVCITACRIFVEFFREPDVGFQNLPFGLTMGQILSTPVLLLGAYLLWWSLRQPIPEPAPVVEAPAPAAAEPAKTRKPKSPPASA